MCIKVKTDHFRVYSDRAHAQGIFLWNPAMDLLLTVPEVSGGVEVWRLIEDEESPLLFSEQLPFQSQAVVWHPEGRKLAVGDIGGNVFILSAEEDERRVGELQKLHGCAISAIDWIQVGTKGSSDTLRNIRSISTSESPHSPFFYILNKLPGESVTTLSAPSILVSLSKNGHLAFVWDASLPIGDIKLPRTSDNQRFCGISAGSQATAVISEIEGEWFLSTIEHGILRENGPLLAKIAFVEQLVLETLKNYHSLLDTQITRNFNSTIDDLKAKLGGITGDELIENLLQSLAGSTCRLSSFFQESFSAHKFAAWESAAVEGLEAVLSALIIQGELFLDKLVILVNEIGKEQKFWNEDSHFELTKSLSSVRLVHRQTIQIARQEYHAIRCFLLIAKGWVDSAALPLEESRNNWFETLLTTESPAAGIGILKSLGKENTAGIIGENKLKETLKNLESVTLNFLTEQRRSISGLIQMGRLMKLGPAKNQPVCKWRSDDCLEVLWVEDVLLHFVRMRLPSYTCEKVVLHSQMHGGIWSHCALHREFEIAVCVTHASATSFCLVDLRRQPWLSVTPDDIQKSIGCIVAPERMLEDDIRAQQLPVNFCEPENLVVSPARNLASVYKAGRLVTIDLLPEEDEENWDDQNNMLS